MEAQGESKPDNPRENHKSFRTHFDLITEKLQTLRVRQKKQKKQYFNLFRTSNAETDQHKQFIKDNDQHRQTQMQWVQGAYDNYCHIISDFSKFKSQTNE